ncbi:MAG: IS4 family transposase [Deltaproteobacteria bacterium]|jgi:hypothetical protein|nr:IS4 family transposase [Deltaproteobacteria bacterium]
MEIRKSNEPFIAQALGLIPRDPFRLLVDKHDSDANCKGFDTWTHLVTMVFSQLTGCESLRDLVGAIATTPERVQQLYLRRLPTKSTLSYNNANRDWKVFQDAFEMMVGEITRRLPRGGRAFDFTNPLYSFDSSTISLSLSLFDWAYYRTRKGGVKIHTLLDNDTCLPVFVSISVAKEHDIIAARSLSLPQGSIVAMDRGYVDYSLFYRWTQEGIFFVTRPKETMNYVVVKDLEIPASAVKPAEDESEEADGKESGEAGQIAKKGKKGKKNSKKGLNRMQTRLLYKRSRPACQVLKDQIIKLKSAKAASDCPIELRLVTIMDPVKNCEMQFVTNKFDLPPATIADIYRDRWEVELFFKCIKQDLVIKSFLGVSENAVRIQLYTAMLAILIVKYLQILPEKISWNFSNLIHLLRINWFTYKVLWDWLKVPHCEKKPPPDGSPVVQFHRLF